MQTPTFAEEAVLGGILLRNENFHEAAKWLTADHFTSAFRQRLWSGLKARILAGEPADAVTISELAPEDADAVWAITNNCTTSRSVPTYVNIVRENWRRRDSRWPHPRRGMVEVERGH